MTTAIKLDLKTRGEIIKPYWKKLTTAGRAAEGLREDWRAHLREVQREIGFEYIRFHGVFHDDMMIYHEDAQGQPYYNWQYFDSLFDFLREVGLRPILELSFTPSALKSGEATVFWWKGNITPPKDYDKWAGLIRATVAHCIDRYGLAEVLQWYFEVWNEPNLYKLFWDADQAEYFKLYGVTAKAVKAIHPGLRVGGPASSDAGAGEAPWLKDFLAFCAREAMPLDFISTHPYPNSWAFDGGGEQVMGYRDANSTLDDLKWDRKAVDATQYKGMEIHLTEWNSSPSPRDLIHDTAFMAPFLIQNNLRCMGLVDSLGFWTFTDVFEENMAGDTQFHGGFGLINVIGLKKPSYYGYWFLARLAEEKLALGDDYILTRRGDDVQILLWNYCHYTAAFASGDRSAFTPQARYGAFDESPRSFQLDLSGLDGTYQVTEYQLDREHGSVLDAWLDNGALENPSAEDVAILQQHTGPTGSISHARFAAGSALKRDITLAPHGVLLIELKKRFTKFD